jgi:ABC-2 type transport system permease protein
LKTFIALIKASFKQLLRDKTSLFFTFAFPVVFMVIFGLIWSGDNNFKASVGVVNEDNSPTSQAITHAFQKISSLTVETGDQADLIARLKKGELRAVVIVPAAMEADIANANPVEIQVYYDPSNTTTTQVVLPMVNQVVEGIGQQVSRHPSVFQLHAQSIQSRQMRSIDYLVPGIIAMSIMSTGLFCALPLIQQREKKILKRWGATPIHRSSIIYSQVAFRLVLSMLQTALLVFIAHAIFNVQMVGNWAVLFGVVALGALVLISIGYLVASFVKTQEGAMPIIQLVQFPMMFLSGIFFPVEMLPGFMKPVVATMPLTYLGDSLRQVMIQSTPLHTMNLNLIVLGVWLVVCVTLSIKLFKWE